MISNKSDLAHERRRRNNSFCRGGERDSLCRFCFGTDTSTGTAHSANDAGNSDAGAAASSSAGSGDDSSDLIAKPAPERTIGEANHEPQTNILATGSLPRDLSPWGMFRNAVLTVKIVMVGLAIASVATWTVALAKTIELWKARRLAGRGLEILAISLRAAEAEIAQVPSPVARFAAAAVEEVKRSDGLDSEGIKDRASILLSRIEAQAGRTIIRGICKPRPQGLPLAG